MTDVDEGGFLMPRIGRTYDELFHLMMAMVGLLACRLAQRGTVAIGIDSTIEGKKPRETLLLFMEEAIRGAQFVR